MKVITYQTLTVMFLVLQVHVSNCFLPLIPVGYTGAGIAGLYAGYSYLKCKVAECCNDKYIPADTSGNLLNWSSNFSNPKKFTEQLFECLKEIIFKELLLLT